MQSGRLDYVHRLSAARLAILRLRFARRWQRMFQRSPSPARTNVFGGLMGVAVLIALAGSAWIGYRAGQLAKVDAMLQAVPVKTAATSQIDRQNASATPVIEHSTALSPAAAFVPVISVVHEPERVDRQAEAARIAELAGLRKTVDKLQGLLQALEQKATGLEVELLNQQIAFAKAEERWKEASVERRVVYNITNIPVGGSVSEERIENDAEQAEFPPAENDFNDQAVSVDDDVDPYQQYRDLDGPVERWNKDTYLADVLEQQSTDANAEIVNQAEGASGQAAGGRVGRYSPRELTVPTGLPSDNRTRQEVFFGPAEDLPDDWVDQ